MPSKFWRRCGGLAVCLALAMVAALQADAKPSDSTSSNDTADPRGTALYMAKLRQLFDKWDVNNDDFLDKEELAKGFRGPDAKPYVLPKSKDADKETSKEEAAGSTAEKKPDYKKYPDYSFLVQLDQDNDGKISRDEFMNWAKEYAVQLKDQAAQEKKLASLESRLISASGKESKTVQKSLIKEQTKLDKINAAMSSADKAMLKLFKK